MRKQDTVSVLLVSVGTMWSRSRRLDCSASTLHLSALIVFATLSLAMIKLSRSEGDIPSIGPGLSSIMNRSASLIVGMAMANHERYSLLAGNCVGPLGFEAAEDLETTRVMFDRLSRRSNARVSLGYLYYDICESYRLGLEAFQVMTPYFPLRQDQCLLNVAGLQLRQDTLRRFIRTRNNTVFAILAERARLPIREDSSPVDFITLMSLFGVPQVSHLESAQSFDNKLEYPTFFRTSISVGIQARTIVDVLERLQVTSFIVLSSPSKEEFSRQIIEDARQRPSLRPPCVVYTALIHINDEKGNRRVVNVLTQSRRVRRVVIMLASLVEAQPFLSMLESSPVSNIVWIGNTDWACRYDVTHSPAVNTLIAMCPPERDDIREDLNAVKSHFVALRSDSPELRSNINLQLFWQERFACRLPYVTTQQHQSLPVCDGGEHLLADTLPVFRRAPALILALRALANAVDNTLSSADPRIDISEVLRNVTTPCPDGSARTCYLFNYNQSPEYEALQVCYKTSNMDRLVAIFDWNAQTGLGPAKTAATGDSPSMAANRNNANPEAASSSSDSGNATNSGSIQQLPLFEIDFDGFCNAQCLPGQVLVADRLAPACCWSCQECDGSLQYSSTANASQCSECQLEHTRASDDHTHCVDIPIERVYWTHPLPVAGTVIIIGLHGTLLVVSLLLNIANKDTPIVTTTGFFNSILQHVVLLYLLFTIPLQYQTGKLSSGRCLAIQLVPFTAVWMTVGLLLDKNKLVHRAWDRSLLKGMSAKARTVALCGAVTSIGSLILGLRLLKQSLTPVASQLDRFTRFQECGDQTWFTQLSIYHIALMVLCLSLAVVTRNDSGGFRQARLVTMSSFLVTIVWLIVLAVNPAIPIDQKPILHTVSFFVHATAIIFPLLAPRMYVMVFRPADNNMKFANRSPAMGRKGESAGRKYLADLQATPENTQAAGVRHINTVSSSNGVQGGVTQGSPAVSPERRRSLPTVFKLSTDTNSTSRPRSPSSQLRNRRSLQLSASAPVNDNGTAVTASSPANSPLFTDIELPPIPTVHGKTNTEHAVAAAKTSAVPAGQAECSYDTSTHQHHTDQTDSDKLAEEDHGADDIESSDAHIPPYRQQQKVSPAPSDAIATPETTRLRAESDDSSKTLDSDDSIHCHSHAHSRTSSVHPASSRNSTCSNYGTELPPADHEKCRDPLKMISGNMAIQTNTGIEPTI
eukprot:scpid18625/ scgid19240/ Metabotropic glutamate receptor 7